MADLSHWFAQACEYHDSEGTFKVIYFHDRQELITVREELLRNGDSWSDDLFSSNMGSNAYKSQVTMPSPDRGTWQPYSLVPALDPLPIPAGGNDFERFISKKLFDDLPGSSTSSAVPKNGIPKASTSIALDQDLLGGNKAPSSQTMATNSSKNDVQEAKEKEKLINIQKSDEQRGLWHRLTKLFKELMRDRRVYSIHDYKTKDQDEGSSSLPRDMINDLDGLNDNPFKDAKPPGYCKYALLFGISTEFNPSGVWVIEELYNDMQELDF